MLKLDSLYIYIGGVSPPPPPTATNHRCCLPRRAGARVGVRALARLTRTPHARKVLGRPKRRPTRAGARSAPTRALYARSTRAPTRDSTRTRESTRRALQASTLREHPTRAPYPRTTCARTLRPLPHARPEPESSRALSEFAPTRWASPPCRCPSPPVAGFISTPAGLLRRARAEAVSCSASCRVKAYANDTARQPTPTRKPRPRGGPSTTPNTATDTGPSAWRERRH